MHLYLHRETLEGDTRNSVRTHREQRRLPTGDWGVKGREEGWEQNFH